MNYIENCHCNEPCYFYTKLSVSSDGTELIRTLINRCSKNSKKNICDYSTEIFHSSEPIKIENKIKEINDTKKSKSEFEKIKEEIVKSIEDLKIRQLTCDNCYMTLEKITALCYRIKIKPFNDKIETIDNFKIRLLKFTPMVKHQKPQTISLISTKEFPFLSIKNTKNTTRLKKNKNVPKINGTSCLIFTNTNSLVKCSIEDDEDEELDDNPFDMDSVDSDNDIEDCYEFDNYKDLEF